MLQAIWTKNKSSSEDFVGLSSESLVKFTDGITKSLPIASIVIPAESTPLSTKQI